MSGVEETGHDLPSLGVLYLVTTQNVPRVPGLCLEPLGVVSVISFPGRAMRINKKQREWPLKRGTTRLSSAKN